MFSKFGRAEQNLNRTPKTLVPINIRSQFLNHMSFPPYESTRVTSAKPLPIDSLECPAGTGSERDLMYTEEMCCWVTSIPAKEGTTCSPSAIEGVLCERTGTREDEDVGVRTNLKFGGGCSLVEKPISKL